MPVKLSNYLYPCVYMLENLGFEPWQEEFINYLANPMDNRTLEQFYKDNDLSQSTVHRWRIAHQEAIQNAVEQRRPRYIAGLRSEAYKALAGRLRKSDNALKLLFQLTGDLVERTEQRIHMTAEEKREKLKTILEQLSAKLNKGKG